MVIVLDLLLSCREEMCAGGATGSASMTVVEIHLDLTPVLALRRGLPPPLVHHQNLLDGSESIAGPVQEGDDLSTACVHRILCRVPPSLVVPRLDVSTLSDEECNNID